jgi:hypothetical protein
MLRDPVIPERKTPRMPGAGVHGMTNQSELDDYTATMDAISKKTKPVVVAPPPSVAKKLAVVRTARAYARAAGAETGWNKCLADAAGSECGGDLHTSTSYTYHLCKTHFDIFVAKPTLTSANGELIARVNTNIPFAASAMIFASRKDS